MNEKYEIIPVANGFILRPSTVREGFEFEYDKFYVFSDAIALGEFIATNFEPLKNDPETKTD